MLWFKRRKHERDLNEYTNIVKHISEISQTLVTNLRSPEEFLTYTDGDDLTIIHELSDLAILIGAYANNPLSRPSTILAFKDFGNTSDALNEAVKSKTAYNGLSSYYKEFKNNSKPRISDDITDMGNYDEAVEYYENKLAEISKQLVYLETKTTKAVSKALLGVSAIRAVVRYEFIQCITDADIIKDRYGKRKDDEKIKLEITKIKQGEKS